MFVQPPNKCWVESEILRFYEVISLLQLNPSATGRGGSRKEGMGRVGDLEPGLFFLLGSKKIPISTLLNECEVFPSYWLSFKL